MVSFAAQEVATLEQKQKNALFLIEIIRADNHGRLAVVRKILEKPVDFNYVHPKFKITPLRGALVSKQRDTVEELLNAGAPVQLGKEQLSPLGTVAAYGYAEFVPLLLQFGAKINASDLSGATPVQLAAEQNRVKCLEELLHQGAQLSTRQDGQSMLLNAVGEKHEAIVRILIKHGADPSESNADELFPLNKAAACGYVSIMNCLLAHGADPNQTNKNGTTAVHMAAYHGKIMCMTSLLRKCPALLNAEDYIGRTPLFWAINQQKSDMVRFLLEQGADLRITIITGESLLELLNAVPHLRKIYERYRNTKPTRKKIKGKKKKRAQNRQTYNQRKKAREPLEHTEVIEVKTPSPEPPVPLDPAKRARAANDLIVNTSDGSMVLSDDGREITFGYKNTKTPIDKIYCLRRNVAPVGPKETYNSRVVSYRLSYQQGDRDLDTVLHTIPEALDRMRGHSIPAHYTDTNKRVITNRIFLGRKLIDGTWVEGLYTLGFTTIRGCFTCYHSFFKPMELRTCIHALSLEIDEADKQLFEQILQKIEHENLA